MIENGAKPFCDEVGHLTALPAGGQDGARDHDGDEQEKQEILWVGERHGRLWSRERNKGEGTE